MVKTILASISMMSFKSGINITKEDEFTPEYKSSDCKALTTSMLFFICMIIALIYSISKTG